MKLHFLLGMLCLVFVSAGCETTDDDDVADDDATADDDVADDDVADDDVADDDVADDDVADDDVADDDVGDDDATADDDVADDDDSTPEVNATVPGDYPTVQAAIDDAADGDVIEVAAGTYAENLDFGGRAIHIVGMDGMAATILDGGQNGPVVRFASGEGADSVLEGFTLTNGSGERIVDEDGSLVPCGGGVFMLGSSPTLLNLAISGNQAHDGAGMFVTDGSAPALTNVTLADNVAMDDGGGMYVWMSAPVLQRVRVVRNVAMGEDGGGIIAKESSAPVLTNVVFAGNIAPDDGGGMRVKSSTADLYNVVFVGNEAGSGAAMAVKASTANLTCVTMADNVASSTGGAIYEKSGGSALLAYSNAWNNQPNNYAGSGGMVDPTGTNGNVSVAPGFLDTSAADPASWDLHLAATSPQIDACTPALLDPDGSAADIGAYGGPDAATWDLDQDGWFEWWRPGLYDVATSPGMDCDDTDGGVYPGSGC